MRAGSRFRKETNVGRILIDGEPFGTRLCALEGFGGGVGRFLDAIHPENTGDAMYEPIR